VDGSFHLSSDGIFRCAAFQQFSWQSHGFGTRQANPPAAVTLRQIHSDLIWIAHGLGDREQEGDALVSNDPGLNIGVRTADCLPILLLDAEQRAVAAVHAGWRGSAAGIVHGAVQKMKAEFNSEPRNVMAAIGPCIRECCYQVGAEVVARFESLVPEWRGTPAEPDGKRHLNLANVNIRQMQAAGVAAGSIFDSGLCTCCRSDIFYSYRQQPGEPGRMTTAIARLS
jgi:YfiH family protein